MGFEVTQLPVAKIRLDGGTQIRTELNQSRIEELVELLQEGHTFKDPITVFYDGTDYWNGDGFHRTHATIKAGLTTIDADVRSGTREDAIEYACGANASHGLPRKNEDKRNAVKTLLNLPKWQKEIASNYEIARQCGVTEFLVRTIRVKLSEENPDHPYAIKSQKPINPPVEPSEGREEVRISAPTNEEKRQKVEQFFADFPGSQELSNREIARRCDVDEGFIRKIKKEMAEEKQRLEQEEAARNTLVTLDPEPTPELESTPEIDPEPVVELETEQEIENEPKGITEDQQITEPEIASEPEPEPEQPKVDDPEVETPEPDSIPEPELVIEEEEESEPITEPEQPQTEVIEPESVPEPEIIPTVDPEPELSQVYDIEDTSEPESVPEQESEKALDPEPAPINISGTIAPSEETLIEREIKRQQTQERNDQLREKGADLPQGKYACLVVDPPWPMKKIERDVRPNQVDFDYPTMTEDELKAFPLPDMAGDDCHLYLWTTQKFLPMAFRLAEHWGFKYQCLMTWVKNVGPTPFSWMYTTEHVLFCSKGNLPLLAIGKRLDFVAKGREHSRKPDVFYDLVREVSPGPRIDVFSRERRDGFEQYGYEVEKYASA